MVTSIFTMIENLPTIKAVQDLFEKCRLWNTNAKGLEDRDIGKTQASEVAHSTNLSSPFFRLPRETRDKIYFFICGDQKMSSSAVSQLLQSTTGPPVYRNCQQPSEATTDRFDIRRLVVNRQFYDEAASIFYSTTYFNFNNNWALSRFLGTVPPWHLSKIRRLELYSCDTTTDVAEWKGMIWSPLVKKLSGLRCLYIDVFFLGFSFDLNSLMSLSSGIEKGIVEEIKWPPSSALPSLSRATLRVSYSAPKNATMSARTYAANACQDLLKYLD